MGRRRLVGSVVIAVACLGACGSARTDLPSVDEVTPAPPLDGVPVASAEATGSTDPTVAETEPTQPPTTASAFKSPGEKHPLAGGTLAPSYPRVGVRPPRGSPPPPPGHQWAVVNVRFCAANETPIDASLVDPARFHVEVPGQGTLSPAPDAPALAKAPLAAGGPGVAPGTCVEGSIAYLVGGEGHIESITYDTGAGLLRWAS